MWLSKYLKPGPMLHEPDLGGLLTDLLEPILEYATQISVL
jgi:hypothetical protein